MVGREPQKGAVLGTVPEFLIDKHLGLWSYANGSGGSSSLSFVNFVLTGQGLPDALEM